MEDLIETRCVDTKKKFRVSGFSFAFIYEDTNNVNYIDSGVYTGMCGKKRLPIEVLTASGSCNGCSYIVVYATYDKATDVQSRQYFSLEGEPFPHVCKSSIKSDCLEFLTEVYRMLDKDSIIYPDRLCDEWLETLEEIDSPSSMSLSELAKKIRGPNYKKGRPEEDGFQLIRWNGDMGAIIADEIKEVLGLKSINTHKFDNGTLMTTFCYGIKLEHIDHNLVCKKDLKKIRMVFAFRYLMGMKWNNSKSIYIINGDPVSYIDVFAPKPVFDRPQSGKINESELGKWFKDGSSPRDYIKMLPVWEGLIKTNPSSNNSSQCSLESKVYEVCEKISEIASRYNRDDISIQACERIREAMLIDDFR